MANEETVSVLNDLIETCRDGEKGFRSAADKVSTAGVRGLFHQFAQQRSKFAAELKNEVLRHGGEPAKSGHASAALHRGWMNLKNAMTSSDDAAIIAEAERGEDAAVANYKGALEKSLPADVRVIIEGQYQQVQEAHARVRSLERARGAGGSSALRENL